MSFAPQPQPKPRRDDLFSLERGFRPLARAAATGEGGGDGGGGPSESGSAPPSDTAQSRTEAWQNAVKKWARQALLFPLGALLLALLQNGSESDAEFFGLKIKSVLVGRELVTVAVAMLLFKLARDAARLFAVACIEDVGLDLAEKSTPDSFIRQDYVRPVDLFDRQQAIGRWRLLRGLESLRFNLLMALCMVVTIASVATLALSLRDMVTAPKLSSNLSRGLAATCAALLVMAAIDLIGIVVSKGGRIIDVRKQWDERVAWCDEAARALQNPLSFPAPWPPLDWKTLDGFYDEIQICQTAEWCKQQASEEVLLENTTDVWPPPSIFDYNALRTLIERPETLIENPPKNKTENWYILWDEYNAVIKSITELKRKFCTTITVPKPRNGDDDTEEAMHRYRQTLESAMTKTDSILARDCVVKWIIHENASLKTPTALPKFWSVTSTAHLENAAEKVMLARWKQDRSVWVGATRSWQREPKEAWFSRKVRAIANALRQALSHPHPVTALRWISSAIENEEASLTTLQLNGSKLEIMSLGVPDNYSASSQ
jgi:hypothetical protein